MSASDMPTTTMLCASWAIVDASAPARRPNPRTRPRPIRPVARCRSTTAIFAEIPPGSATMSPSATAGSSTSASVTIWSGTTPITRARATGPGDGEVASGQRADAHRLLHPLRHLDTLDLVHLAPMLEHELGLEALEVGQEQQVRLVAGRDRAEVVETVPESWMMRGHHDRILGSDAERDRVPDHRVHDGPHRQCARARGRRCRRRSATGRTRHEREQRMEVSRAGGLADQEPHTRPGAAPAPPPLCASWSERIPAAA